MVRLRSPRFVVLGLLLLLCAACEFDPPQSSELATRTEITDHVKQLLVSWQFDELDTLAEGYRSTRARTSSGIWKLSIFYGGFNKIYPRKRLSEDLWAFLAVPVHRWIEHNPRSATARLVYAKILINHAWGIRGTGYAHTVEESQWDPFFAKVEEARSYLEEHKSIAASDPYWYDAMAEVATMQGWPDAQFSALLREAFDRDPLYYETYFQAANRSLPKWGGSADKLEALAREAVQRTRDADGSGLYARIYWFALGDALFKKSRVDWEEMKRGIDDVLAKYPDDWNLNHFAKFACLAGDYAKASELIERIEGEPLRFVWGPYWYRERCLLRAVIAGL